MKFSFDSQEYRDDLALELQDTDKSERKALFEKKRKTLRFVLAEHIREFTRKSEQRLKQGSVEVDSSVDQVQSKKVEIDGVAEWGNKYKVNVEIFDISNEIPESVKVIYDMNRLLEVEYNYKNDDVSRGWYQKDDRYHKQFGTGYISRDEDDSFSGIVKNYIKLASAEKGEPLTKDDGSVMSDADLADIVEQAKKDFVEFREKVTGGLVSSPHVFYHTIGAYTEGFNSDWYDTTMLSRDSVGQKLKKRFPHDKDGAETEIVETPLEIDENLVSNGLYVHSGKLLYDNPLKPLCLLMLFHQGLKNI